LEDEWLPRFESRHKLVSPASERSKRTPGQQTGERPNATHTTKVVVQRPPSTFGEAERFDR